MRRLPLLSSLPLLALAGCARAPTPATPGVKVTYAAPVAEAPPASQVRIEAEKVEEGETTIHWTWKIRGDRNWSRVNLQISGTEVTGFSITDVIPEDPNTVLAGPTDAYEVDLTVTIQDVDGKPQVSTRESLTAVITTRTLANVTSSASGPSTNFPDGPRPSAHSSAREVVKIRLAGKHTLKLPIDVPLYEIDETRAEGDPPKARTMTLKIAE
jgi:hypothetical protein